LTKGVALATTRHGKRHPPAARAGFPFSNLDYFFRYRNPQAIMDAFANPR
jgi:hypothetical protein